MKLKIKEEHMKYLEKAVKQEFDWDIQMDGRGHSEWVSQTCDTIETKIDDLIEGYRFKITKLPKRFMPLTVDNLDKVLDYIKEQQNT